MKIMRSDKHWVLSRVTTSAVIWRGVIGAMLMKKSSVCPVLDLNLSPFYSSFRLFRKLQLMYVKLTFSSAKKSIWSLICLSFLLSPRVGLHPERLAELAVARGPHRPRPAHHSSQTCGDNNDGFLVWQKISGNKSKLKLTMLSISTYHVNHACMRYKLICGLIFNFNYNFTHPDLSLV